MHIVDLSTIWLYRFGTKGMNPVLLSFIIRWFALNHSCGSETQYCSFTKAVEKEWWSYSKFASHQQNDGNSFHVCVWYHRLAAHIVKIVGDLAFINCTTYIILHSQKANKGWVHNKVSYVQIKSLSNVISSHLILLLKKSANWVPPSSMDTQFGRFSCWGLINALTVPNMCTICIL